MRTIFRYGGVAASIVLIALGIGAIVVGLTGRADVANNLKQEAIVGTPDMTPAAIAREAKAAGLANVSLPSCSVAGQSIDTGNEARCFAQYMRIHALEATGGKTYAQMPRYATADGAGTNDATQALTRGGQPVDNAARNVWVTETALSTALNTSYFAQSVGLFAAVMGAALLLTGIGFLLLTTGLLAATGDAIRVRRAAAAAPGSAPAHPAAG
ncbi:MAG: hypothetical protein JSS99_16895 [Actinobacteria bacterium]|nr:hypothetical protein [Actinomycetota bacterium]